MDKVKYVHILWQDETKFSFPLVKIFNDPEYPFKKEEHLFVTPHKAVYNFLNSFDNVILDTTKKNLINKYADSCDWIIFHGHLTPLQGIKIKKKYFKKVILRFWGGNLEFVCKQGQPLKNIARKTINYIFMRKLTKLAAIGIANKVDELAVRAELKDIPIYEMPYSAGKGLESILKILNQGAQEKSGINVLLGHSGRAHDNHVKIMEKLSKYEDKISIYVPLSYGDNVYRKEVEEYINKKNWENITIIKDFMPYDEYVRLLEQMDIAIFDGEKSYALGNISILLLLKKKFFLNRHGIIKTAFDAEKIPCACVDDIDNMSFDEFVQTMKYSEEMSENLLPYSRKRALGAWTKLLTDFN